MTVPIDADLVRRAAGRDHDAMAALLTELRPGLVRYCRARLGRIGGAYTTADDVEGIFTSGSGNYNAAIAALFTVEATGAGTGVITNLDTATLTGGVVDSGSVQGAAE